MNNSITYFHRHPKAGFSINKVSQTYIREVEKQMDVEQFYVPCHRADPISLLRNLWFLFKHRNKKGVNHITGDIHYGILALIGCKSILTVHDTCLLEHAKSVVKRNILKFLWYKLPLRIASKIVCISEKTQTEISKITKRKDIQVIHNAVDSQFCSAPKEFNKEKPVVLQIGTGWNKNLLNAASALFSIPCHLRIIGKLSLEQQEALGKNQIDYSAKSDLADEEIVEEYKNCDMVCFCSIFEGFGLPVVEAQAIGRIVITSNINPMAEVAGNGALYVNPQDANEIKAGVLSMIQDDNLRNKIIQNGYKNVERFNFTSIAQKYIELYQEVLNDLI